MGCRFTERLHRLGTWCDFTPSRRKARDPAKRYNMWCLEAGRGLRACIEHNAVLPSGKHVTYVTRRDNPFSRFLCCSFRDRNLKTRPPRLGSNRRLSANGDAGALFLKRQNGDSQFLRAIFPDSRRAGRPDLHAAGRVNMPRRSRRAIHHSRLIKYPRCTDLRWICPRLMKVQSGRWRAMSPEQGGRLPSPCRSQSARFKIALTLRIATLPPQSLSKRARNMLQHRETVTRPKHSPTSHTTCAGSG
jgi:hypothetical protein